MNQQQQHQQQQHQQQQKQQQPRIKDSYAPRVVKEKLLKLWSILKQVVAFCGPKAAYFDRIEYDLISVIIYRIE